MGTFKVSVGVMNTAKSTRALVEIFNLRQQNISVIAVKPMVDARDGGEISSRIIKEKVKANIVLGESDDINLKMVEGYKYIVVDEFHMLTEKQIMQLYKIAAISEINVSLYGLKMSYTGIPFPAACLALGYADKIEHIEAVDLDGHLLTHHLKYTNGELADITKPENLIEVGDVQNERENEVFYKSISKEDFYKIYGILNKI